MFSYHQIKCFFLNRSHHRLKSKLFDVLYFQTWFEVHSLILLWILRVCQHIHTIFLACVDLVTQSEKLFGCVHKISVNNATAPRQKFLQTWFTNTKKIVNKIFIRVPKKTVQMGWHVHNLRNKYLTTTKAERTFFAIMSWHENLFCKIKVIRTI